MMAESSPCNANLLCLCSQRGLRHVCNICQLWPEQDVSSYRRSFQVPPTVGRVSFSHFHHVNSPITNIIPQNTYWTLPEVAEIPV